MPATCDRVFDYFLTARERIVSSITGTTRSMNSRSMSPSPDVLPADRRRVSARKA
jgi:hypothetical protein